MKLKPYNSFQLENLNQENLKIGNPSINFDNREIMEEVYSKAKKSQRVIVEIIFSILDFLLKFVSPKNNNNPSYSKFNTKEKIRKCNLECIKNSQIIQKMIQFLSKYGIHFQEFAMLVFDVMRELAKDEMLARKLCRENALSVVIGFLADNSSQLRNYEVHLGFEVIWNTLSRVGRKAMRGLLNKNNILHIRRLFTNVLIRTCKLEDKCLRNELMILFCYVLDNAQSQDFLFDSIDDLSQNLEDLGNLDNRRITLLLSKNNQLPIIEDDSSERSNKKVNLKNLKSNIRFQTQNTMIKSDEKILETWLTFDVFLYNNPSMVEILFYLATCDEDPSRQTEYFDTSNEDLQFKLLVYYGISLLIKNNPKLSKIRVYLERTSFVKRILFHVNKISGKKFSDPQKREIETEILRLIARTIETLFQDFMKFEGITVLLKYMVLTKDSQKKILCLQIFLALLQIKDDGLAKNLDGTLVDHVIDNVSGDIDLHSLEDIGMWFLIDRIANTEF